MSAAWAYATRTDAIRHAILPALGEYAAEHDVEAIVDACFTYVPGRGFVQSCDVDEFWRCVEAAAL